MSSYCQKPVSVHKMNFSWLDFFFEYSLYSPWLIGLRVVKRYLEWKSGFYASNLLCQNWSLFLQIRHCWLADLCFKYCGQDTVVGLLTIMLFGAGNRRPRYKENIVQVGHRKPLSSCLSNPMNIEWMVPSEKNIVCWILQISKKDQKKIQEVHQIVVNMLGKMH